MKKNSNRILPLHPRLLIQPKGLNCPQDQKDKMKRTEK